MRISRSKFWSAMKGWQNLLETATNLFIYKRNSNEALMSWASQSSKKSGCVAIPPPKKTSKHLSSSPPPLPRWWFSGHGSCLVQSHWWLRWGHAWLGRWKFSALGPEDLMRKVFSGSWVYPFRPCMVFQLSTHLTMVKMVVCWLQTN